MLSERYLISNGSSSVQVDAEGGILSLVSYLVVNGQTAGKSGGKLAIVLTSVKLFADFPVEMRRQPE